MAANRDGDKWTLTLPSVGVGEAYEVYAIYERGSSLHTVGKLNVISYIKQNHTVTIVPVNANVSDVERLQNELNAIYNPYGVNFTLKVDESIFDNKDWDTDGDGKLSISGSGFFSKESGEMKSLRKLYQAQEKYDKNAYYLFILNEAVASGEPDEKYAVMGDMPRGKQFGYIFNNKVSSSELGWLAAHELGHGIFTLSHSFDTNYSGDKYKAQTSNLMDYNHGYDLGAFQWNVMANPAPLTWFDSDGDGLAVNTLIDLKHTKLFDHVYNNNLKPYNTSNIVAYQSNYWEKDWTYFENDHQESIDAVINILKGGTVDEIIPKISLHEQTIYIGKVNIEQEEYAIALYSRKAEINKLKKIALIDIDQLTTPEIKKHLFCGESNSPKYMILAFYEDGDSEPVLILQAIKFGQKILSDDIFVTEWLSHIGMLKNIQILNNNKYIAKESIVLITNTPEMPNIKVKTGAIDEVDLRLVITYQRDGQNITDLRNDISYYPVDDWKRARSNETWNIDFGQDFIGGTAYLLCRHNEKIDTTKFYIRGENPTENQIKTYLDQRGYRTRYWFIVQMTRQESSMLQFGNTSTYSTTNLTGTRQGKGEPLYGPPRGFGLKQLDNWGTPTQYATAQHLWNWKANIEGGVDVIREKKAVMENYKRQDEKIITAWDDKNPDDKVGNDLEIKSGAGAGTIVTTITEGNITFAVEPTGDQKDIYDAVWVRLFNGGRYYKVVETTDENGDIAKPVRHVFRNNNSDNNYVNDVCSRQN